MLSDAEQINTMEVNEALLSILLAAAQEESAAKSENIKFGIRQRMRSGKAVLNHTRFLGYTKDEDGRLVVVQEEAKIVRKIFSLYLEGYGVRKIKRYLEENGIKTVTGKSEWSTSTIDRMLSNEKYMGNLLLQKTCTPDFLTGGDKDHLRTLQRVGDLVLALLGGALANLRVSTGTAALGQLGTKLDLLGGLGVEQSLLVGVHRDELDPGQTGLHHAVDGVAAAATYADNLDIGYILHFFVENECHECIPLKVML